MIRFLILLATKSLRYLIYPTKVGYVGDRPSKSWHEVKIVILLNHTSLAEFLYAGLIPNSFLWRMAHYLVFPCAEETLRKPIMGRLLKAMAPDAVPVSRKRDDTWANFMTSIQAESVMIFFPEGRMKRLNGLDKNGKPMTCKGGIVEVLQALKTGKMLIVYSGGLHHVLAPEQKFPRIFKRLKANVELKDIKQFLESNQSDSPKGFRLNICQALDDLRDSNCPQLC